MKLVSVVIPVYKQNLTSNEHASFVQCLKILANHPITLFCPRNLDTRNYLEIARTKNITLQIESFDERFFTNIDGYNSLMLSADFYRRFADYKYILVYQLDAWVFKDELAYWCNKNYDYTGAPWINLDLAKWFTLKIYPKEIQYYYKYIHCKHKIQIVGNGGLSLRKTQSMIRNLRYFKHAIRKWNANEDSFFAHYIGLVNPFFKIAPFKEALMFSFDANPQMAFQLNNNNLPFGCHAWSKKEPPYKTNDLFWRNHINPFENEIT